MNDCITLNNPLNSTMSTKYAAKQKHQQKNICLKPVLKKKKNLNSCSISILYDIQTDFSWH